jgi:hypothetical protein
MGRENGAVLYVSPAFRLPVVYAWFDRTLNRQMLADFRLFGIIALRVAGEKSRHLSVFVNLIPETDCHTIHLRWGKAATRQGSIPHLSSYLLLTVDGDSFD